MSQGIWPTDDEVESSVDGVGRVVPPSSTHVVYLGAPQDDAGREPLKNLESSHHPGQCKWPAHLLAPQLRPPDVVRFSNLRRRWRENYAAPCIHQLSCACPVVDTQSGL